jgi:pimeloyl-ACP methyl ester carboxylesterase
MILNADVEIFYNSLGTGADVVLLHPYPSDHGYWQPAAIHWSSRFRLLMPDLRGLGRSGVGEGASTMAKLADDLLQLCEAENVGRAVFVGCSVGCYVLFEFWRRHRERIKALVLTDTRAGMDTDEGRLARLKNAEETLLHGPEWAVEQMLPRLLSPQTLRSRPDVAEAARQTMLHASARGLAAMQRGMAERPDSTPTLADIDVPVLVLGGEDDLPSPPAELERMARAIRGAELKIIPKAGHLAAFEQPEEVGRLVRDFLERHGR